MRTKVTQSTVALWMVLGLGVALLWGCGATPTPIPSPTSPPTETPTPTLTPTPSPSPTPTPLPLAEWVKEGDALGVKSDYAGAEAAYQRVLNADPSYAPAHAGLAWAYGWQTGREKEAVEHAQKAAELAPDDAALQALLARVQASLFLGEDAVKSAEKAAALDAKSSPAQRALASAYLLDRQYDEALKGAEQALALDPESADAFYTLGRVYREMADYSRACAAFEKAIALQPQFVPWQSTLASLWDEMDRDEQAVAAYEKALEQAPEDVDLLLGLASAQMDLGRYPESEAQVKRAAELVPDSPDPDVAWGYLYLAQDESDKALEQFRKALTKEPDYYWAQRGIADVNLNQDECDAAAQQAEKLTTLQPRFAEGRMELGYAKLCAGDPAKALESFRKAVELEPYNAWAYLGMGHAYAQQERWEDATAAQVNALYLAAAPATAHVALAWNLMMQGENERARDEFETALRLDPTLGSASTGLASFLLEDGRPGAAQALIEQALAHDPHNDDARLMQGMALYRQGQAQQAADALKKLIQDKPELAQAHYYLGLAYRDLGQYADAKKELETYQALSPNASGQTMVSALVQALGQGYKLKEAKALSDLKEGLASVTGTELQLKFEEIEGRGRTLVISLSKAANAKQSDLVMTMVSVVAGSAVLVPRVDPPVAGGVLVRVIDKGKPLYVTSLDMESIRLLADGIDSGVGLRSKLQISRALDKGQAWLRQLETDVADVRALKAKKDVPSQPLTPESLAAYTATSVTSGTQRAGQASQALLTVLGVITPTQNLEQLMAGLYAVQVPAFYDLASKTLYVQQATEQTSWAQMSVAHEYTHALQDQSVGLQETAAKALDGDQKRAFAALLEADAALTMFSYADQSVLVYDLYEANARTGGMDTVALKASPSFIQGVQYFPYEAGLTYLFSLYQSGEWNAVDEAYTKPPLSTEQVLHPDLYHSGEAPVAITLPDLAAALGAGWSQLETDVLGELGLQLLLAQHVAPGAAALAAEGWGGDRYALLQKGEGGPHVLVVQTQWDDADEAEQFWQVLRATLTHWQGYTEDVRELTGVLTSRWWKGDQGVAMARHEGETVTLILAPDDASVNQVLPALK